MILTNNRSDLDTALGMDHSICVLPGAENSDAGRVHACLETRTWGNKPWHEWFLVTDQNLLTDAERSAWFNAGDDFAYLGRNDKHWTSSGKTSDVLLLGDVCDFLAITGKFGEADQN